LLTLASHEGVVDYVPGDLTITVRAGTTLSEIANVTNAEGQWLPLDPHGESDGTIGATIATGSFGALAHGFGRARDLVLGVEFITGDGKVVRGGGRVVKNVAGFDLVRLITGSWGTLGVITEVTLRLYSVQSPSSTISLNLPDGAGGIAQRVASVIGSGITPFAMEIVNAATARKIGLAARRQILLRLGGNAAAVGAQRETLSSLGGAHDVTSEVWHQLRLIESVEDSSDSRPIVVRLSSVPNRLAELWVNTERAVAGVEGAMVHATHSIGIVRCVLPANTPAASITALASSTPGVTAIFERLPPALWPTISPSVISDRISQRLRKAFDPNEILNPGILGPVN
jgi:glycolate oxidase FAD binding subunit